MRSEAHRNVLETEVAPLRSFASNPDTDRSASARVLPPSAYQSLAFQAREDAGIWTRAWVGIGFEADVADVGDVLPFTVGNHGIHVERLGGGALVGRFNKAQHGGCRAVPLQCQTGSKTKCSFTACGYSRDRGPIAANGHDRFKHLDQYLGLRPERLLPVAIRTWGPLIFANLDPSREATDEGLDVTPPLEGVAGGETIWLEYGANWKHMVVALAARDTSGITARITFPNVVSLISNDAVCMVVLQPTALGKTLCRIRLSARASGPATCEMLAWVAARGARAEALHADVAISKDEGLEPGLDPAARWFERKVLSAFDALDRATPDAVLYQTRHKGGW